MMKKAGKRLMGLMLAVIVTASATLAIPLQVGAAAPSVEVQSFIAFAGHEWLVVGNESSGVATGNANHVTLLHSNDCSCMTGGGFGTTSYGSDNVYEGSNLHTAMTNIATSIQTASDLEYDLIVARTLDGVNGPGNAGGQGTDTMTTPQKVWPLSSDEIGGFSGNTTWLGYGSDWWLRSPEPGDAYLARLVHSDGGGVFIEDVGFGQAFRPAFVLNLSSAIFASDASGASAKSSAAAGGSWLSATPTTNAIKLTLPDSGLTLTSPTVAGVSGDTITFSYDATGSTSSFNRLSAIVTDSTGDTVKYYGNLADNPAANGIASVTVPGSLDATDKLLVFVEQVNANTDTTQPDSYLFSDFASNRLEIQYSIQAAPAGLTGVAPTGYQSTDGRITGTTADMEYSSDNGMTWTSCTASPTMGLAAGNYQVRYKAKMNGLTPVIASPAVTVTVSEGVSVPTVGSITAPAAVDVGQTLQFTPPTVSWNGENGMASWQVSPNGTSDWVVFPTSTTVAAIHNGQYLRFSATNSKGTGYSSNIVQITVNLPAQADAGQNTVTAPGTVTEGKAFTITAAGHRQNATGIVAREQRYVPVSWSINPSGAFPSGGPYTASVTLNTIGSHTLTVTYQLQEWNGSWQDVAGSTDTKQTTVNVLAQNHDPIDPPGKDNPIDLARDLTITFNGEWSNVADIRLNGHSLTRIATSATRASLSGYPGYSEVLGIGESGSVKVTLYKEFLQWLPDGVYSLEVEFNDGGVVSSGTADFLIRREAVSSSSDPASSSSGGATTTGSSPQTGDNSNMGLWATLLVISIAALAVCLVWYKRRKAA